MAQPSIVRLTSIAAILYFSLVSGFTTNKISQSTAGMEMSSASSDVGKKTSAAAAMQNSAAAAMQTPAAAAMQNSAATAKEPLLVDAMNTKSTQDPPTFLIEEQTPPLVTYPESPFHKVIMNHDTLNVIQCKAKGHPPPKFEWFLDGARQNSDDRYIKAFPNGTLMLMEHFSYVENGYYQCKAINPLGTSLSEIIHIQAQVAPSENGRKRGKEDKDTLFVRTEGFQFDLECDGLNPTVPSMEKRWYTNRNNELQLDNRKGVDTDGTLHIAYVVKEDENVYTCGLVPETGTKNTINLFQRGKLSVKEGPASPANTRPKLVFSKKNVKGVIGHSVVLECFFASKPPASIKWKNSSNHDLTRNNPRFEVFDYGRKLRIVKVEQQDEGVFTCTGTNTFGSVDGRITINVTSAPRAVDGKALEPRTVHDNQDLTLYCKTIAAVGEKLEAPRWFRNGIRLTQNNVPDPSRYTFSSDLTELKIKDLNKQIDTACFQCNTSNSEGYEFFDASLRVINSIVVTKRPADENVINYGDVLDVTILTKGDICCENDLRWQFNGSDIIEPEQWLPFQKDPNSDQLLFNTSLIPLESFQSYLGLYKCRVSNFYQNVYVTFSIINQRSRNEPVAEKEATIGLWWIGVLCGVLAILIAIIIVVAVYKVTTQVLLINWRNKRSNTISTQKKIC